MQCSAIETETESLSCGLSQQCPLILEEVAEAAEEGPICVTSHPSHAPHMWGAGDVFQDHQSELETPDKVFYFRDLRLTFFCLIKT